ncbi:MAG: hypothetical protein ACE37F_10770 [Nannocystaceae bacterium]|nr:hypothetical protein [bacterium]
MRRAILGYLCCLLLACDDDAQPPAGSTSDSSGAAPSGGSTTDSNGSSDSTGATSGPSSTGQTNDGTTGATTDATTAATGVDAESTGEVGDASSGGESTGAVLPRGQWAMTEITYTQGGASETLTMQDRAFCDATLDGGVLLLRYQQAQGFTVWSLYIPMASGVGSQALTQDFSGAYMNLNEVSDTWMAYFDPSMAFGTLTLTDAEIQDGGVVAGTLTASLTSNDGTTAEFSSTFYAEIP